jgi:trans-aconitate 2-methyltransferase
MQWDVAQYIRYAGERGRPFVDLIARIDAPAPRSVIDLGCGPGNLTALLADRWPDAVVTGLDSSPEMISTARSVPGISFDVQDIRTWEPTGDVVVSNAALQWIPEHPELIGAWCERLAPGSWLAFQVPGNFSAPSHTVMRSLASSDRWRSALGDVPERASVLEPSDYASLLLDAGWSADVWETTYLHRLPGADPVLEWLRGTGLRPILAALSPAEVDAFSEELAPPLRAAYPPGPHGTILPFRRIFAVGHKPGT